MKKNSKTTTSKATQQTVSKHIKFTICEYDSAHFKRFLRNYPKESELFEIVKVTQVNGNPYLWKLQVKAQKKDIIDLAKRANPESKLAAGLGSFYYQLLKLAYKYTNDSQIQDAWQTKTRRMAK